MSLDMSAPHTTHAFPGGPNHQPAEPTEPMDAKDAPRKMMSMLLTLWVRSWGGGGDAERGGHDGTRGVDDVLWGVFGAVWGTGARGGGHPL